jgi:antitoxin (DNA-binding transcriptional repressor) of toxin-antitoxin stability system
MSSFQFAKAFSCLSVSLPDAKTNLSHLIKKAPFGEARIAARGDKPVARLVAFGEVQGKRPSGSRKGKFFVGREFSEPLPSDRRRIAQARAECIPMVSKAGYLILAVYAESRRHFLFEAFR